MIDNERKDMKKIEITENYLNNILEALEDAKGLCIVYGFKNEYQKHIAKAKKYLEKLNER